MIPRDYQRAAVDAARPHRRTWQHHAGAAHGAGKAAIAGFYIGEELEQRKHDRVLVLQHRRLIDQNRSAIGTVTGMPTSVVKAEQDDWDGRIVFGSVEYGRASRRERMAPVSHLVIDECHRSRREAIIIDRPGAQSGDQAARLSATPGRGDGRSLRRTFSNVGYHLKIGTLIGRGLLVPPRTYTIDLGVEDELAGLGATAGDFDMRAADKVLNRSVLNEAVVEHWQAKAADRRTIFFCATVDHADAVAEAFRTAGVTARRSGGCHRGRASTSSPGSTGARVQVLTNCMVLTEGFDSQPSAASASCAPCCTGYLIRAVGRGLRRVDPRVSRAS